MKKIMCLTVFLVTLQACSGSDNGIGSNGNTNFYSLSSPVMNSSVINNQLSVGIGPIEIPRLLNRPQIVSRKNSNELIIAERHQWGGSYKEEFTNALMDNFSLLLKTERIEEFPWKSTFKPNYQVRVDVQSFDGEIANSVILNVRWRIIKNNQEILTKKSAIEVKTANKSYNAYVKAQSKAITSLCQEIIAAVNSYDKKPKITYFDQFEFKTILN